MTRLTTIFLGTVLPAFTLLVFAAVATPLAHEGNDHVRGVVAARDAHTITVRTTAEATTVLTIDEKTTFRKGGKMAKAADLVVGGRVVIDVPRGTTVARLVQFSAPPPAAK
ncbi:MAG: hypothetical protein ABUS56_06735 [Acidobacteriota bacterium]